VPPAFASFDEPHAWLIRGLVEYGWPDLTPFGGRIPAGRAGGMELARFRDSGGRDGLHLLMVAASGPQLCQEDGVYDFSVRCFRRDGAWMVGVRCPEANFIQEFPFDPGNPTWVAGYVHQAVTAYVPQFVGWRLQGGELSWAQRKGLPEIEGEACSAAMTRFVDELVRMRRGADTGPTEGWWLGRDSLPPPAGQAAAAAAAGRPIAPIAALGGAVAVAGRAAGGGASPTEQALKKAGPAGRALSFASGVLALLGGVSLLNALLTVALFLVDRPAAMAGSGCFGLLLLGGGIAGILGGRKLSRCEASALPWIAIAANLVLPLMVAASMLFIDLACCAGVSPVLVCVPIALYALYVQVDPKVKLARRELAPR